MQLFVVLVVSHVSLNRVDAVYECISGMWGSQCTKTCGFCEGGNEFCHVYDGYCVNGCASGYKGTYCKDPCDAGTYGQYCRHDCGKCSSVRPICDSETGKCLVGCQPGYQIPYCTTPCPFNTWGEGCTSKCQCKNVTKVACGCNHVTGECIICQEDTAVYHYPVRDPKCLEEHMLFGKVTEYVPPDVLNFPYKPILALGSTVAMFVFGNFLWWWFMVRNPKPKDQPPEIKRAKKPPKRKTAQLIKYRKTLGDYAKKTPTKRRKSSAKTSYSVDDGSAMSDDA